MVRTTPQDASHMQKRRVPQIYEWSMEPLGHRQIKIGAFVLRSLKILFSNLLEGQPVILNYGTGIRPRPSSSISREFASKLCPDLIIHPQPVSDVKPPWSTSWLRRRTDKDIDDAALGSWDFGIAGKFERYVSQILASKSSRNADGHPPSWPPESYASVESTLLAVLSGGVADWIGGGISSTSKLPL